MLNLELFPTELQCYYETVKLKIIKQKGKNNDVHFLRSWKCTRGPWRLSSSEDMLKNKFTVNLFAVSLLLLHGASDVATDRVSVFVMQGDSVTLHTNITIKQDRVKWYFTDTLIAHISGDLRYICTDVQCNKDNERFRDRLKLDHQTGDLTITNINTSDAEVYQLRTRSSSRIGDSFDVAVHDVPSAEIKRKSLMEGESVTLDTSEVKNPNDVMTWYFNNTRIAEITGDQSKICTDVQCNERFRDRLELNHQTGSLIITNTRNTDSGDYKLQIKSGRNRYSSTSIKSFIVSVTDSGLSSAVKAGIYVAVVLMVAAAVAPVIYHHLRSSKKDEGSPHDRRGSRHRAGAKGGHSRAAPPQMNYCDVSFHSLPESESE